MFTLSMGVVKRLFKMSNSTIIALDNFINLVECGVLEGHGFYCNEEGKKFFPVDVNHIDENYYFVLWFEE